MIPDAYLAEFSEPVGYLDFASVGPVSHAVARDSNSAFEWLHAPTHGRVIETIIGYYDSGKARVAEFLSVPVDAVAIVPTTSSGLFQVAFGLGEGDGAANVVVASHEFPANVYPWIRAADRGGPEVRLFDVPDQRLTADHVAAAVDGDTVAVAVSLVDFRTGYRTDLAALREAAGEALLVVDAIQGLGAVEFPAAAADVIVTGGQKWLRAGWGAGFISVAPRAMERLAPALTGWFGVDDFLDTDVPPPHPARADAERFQEGSPVVFGAVVVEAALDVLGIAGVASVEKTIFERVGQIEDVLRSAGAELLTPWRHPGERAGILSFRLPGEDPAVTAERLRDGGLVFSERGAWLRVAPHASTSVAAVRMLEAAL